MSEENKDPNGVVEIELPKSENNIYSPSSDGGNDQGEWLTSYADLMTLIACFFILMMAFANYDTPSFNRMSKAVATHFTGHEKLEKQIDQLEMLAKELMNHAGFKGIADVQITEDGIVITFSGSALFDSGSADIRPEVNNMLDSMATMISQKSKKFRIIVEGHTDNVPLKEGAHYLSNWELSGARASRIIQRFEKKGFNPNQLLAIGYGETRPKVPNTDKNGKSIEVNQQLNRRVVFKILAPHDEKGQEKLGLGLTLGDEAVLSNDKKNIEAEKK